MPQKGQITKKQAKEIARIWVGSAIRREAAEVNAILWGCEGSDIIIEAIQELGDKMQQGDDYCSDLKTLISRVCRKDR